MVVLLNSKLQLNNNIHNLDVYDLDDDQMA
jgi:hypothetical protein